MAEYIDRHAAIRAIVAREFHDCGECERAKEGSGDDYCFNEGLLNAADAVQNLPAADVVEARRGEWMPAPHKQWWYHDIIAYCSECGWGVAIWERDKFNYCPNCGAKMDESEEKKK